MKSKDADQLINGLHEKAFEKINCLECANCCKGLGPRLIISNIERISAHLKIKSAEFADTLLRIDKDGDFVLKPCYAPFYSLIIIARFTMFVQEHAVNILIPIRKTSAAYYLSVLKIPKPVRWYLRYSTG